MGILHNGFGRAALTFASLMLGGLPAMAQDLIEAVPPEPFNENFDRNSDVSGAKLVGLRVGTESGSPAGPIFIRLDTPASALCVRTVTQDGRYSASNPFAIPAAETGIVKIGAISREFSNDLNRYPFEAVAIRIFAGASGDCNPGGALNLPYSTSPDGGTTLVAYANARAFAGRAQLLDEAGTTITEARCDLSGAGARIAYDMACTMTLPPGAARTGTLNLVLNDGFTDEVTAYRIAIPAVAQP